MADNDKFVKMMEGSLYSEVHEDVKYNRAQYGFQPLQGSSKEFVSVFLKNMVKQYSEDMKSKVQCKPVMLDCVKTRTAIKKSKRKKVSAREKRLCGLYNISSANQRYEMYLPLHKLWQDYMRSMLNLHSNSNLKFAYPKLLRADYHGCILTVSRSKCPSYIGASGILLQETKNTFKIITKENQLKMIPKSNSVFTFELESFVFTIHGNHFRYRSSERSTRKFKRKPTIDL